MASVLLSSTCHYCGVRGRMTEDHVVPRADLPRPLSRLPYWFRSQNVVASCGPCNNTKGCFRSDCECAQCTWAWRTAQALFMPIGYQPRGYIAVVRDRPLDVVLVA